MKEIYLKINKNIWLGIIPLLFIMGGILNISGVLGYTGDYMLALKMSQEENVQGDLGGFYTVGKLFHIINIFGIKTLTGWSIFLMIIFCPIIYYYCRELTVLSVTKTVFLCGFIIYFAACACNISKEAIQVIFFILIDVVAFSEKVKNKYSKILLISLICVLNGLILRKYFFLVAVVFVGLSFIHAVKPEKRHRSLLRGIVLFFLGGFMILSLAKVCVPALYYQVANTRTGLLVTYSNANTLIRDLVNINNFEVNWLVNYAIRTLRIMFPVELALKEIKYIPFVIVQIIFSVNLIRLYGSSGRSENYRLAYFFLLAFIIVELVWEVDSGTMFRHETSAIVLMIDVIMKKDKNVDSVMLYKNYFLGDRRKNGK